jgi:WD40 repeat protein
MCHVCWSTVSSYVCDVKGFIQAFHNGILESPLQIYWSELLFTPQQTMLYGHYKEHVCKLPVKLLQGSELEWRVLNTTSRHKEGVLAVTFSPGGTLITSRSNDSTVCIWDVKTGAAVG